MTQPAYNWREDARRCYDVGIAAKREIFIRAGEIEPQDERERRWAREGYRPPRQLEAGRT